jgi:hypothetical protein
VRFVPVELTLSKSGKVPRVLVKILKKDKKSAERKTGEGSG